MNVILGISAFYHDSAAALVVDGEVVAAAQEERFTRHKHDASFPVRAIESCLEVAGLQIEEVDHVGFYEKPLLKFDRLLETYLLNSPRGMRSFLKAMPSWLSQKLRSRREIRRGLDGRYQGRVVFCEHHQSHAASAFFPSPFEQAAILTMDGVGEWATSSLGVGCGNKIDLTHEMRFPDSLGLLYSALTYYTGFEVNSGEYKLMGLAPYGEPVYADLIRERLIKIHSDGSFTLDQTFFNYSSGLTMTSNRFHSLFGRPPRARDSRITKLDQDLAASIQVVTEDVIQKTAIYLHELTGQTNLCLAGGVALNSVANGRLLREGPFDQVWIQPAAGDAGGALGVALFIWHQLLQHSREPKHPDAQHASLLGPSISAQDAECRLERLGAKYERIDSPDQLREQVVDALESGQVVGRFVGRMEFGPRALGNRSILGDPRNAEMQSRINSKVKGRESFRPFAPIVLNERSSDYFDVPGGAESPYMAMVFNVNEHLRCDPEQMPAKEGLDELHSRARAVRSTIPAVTHVDFSARVQTVDAQRNPGLYELLRAWHGRTGCPVLLNTSFNVRGEPIVCTPEDAFHCFMTTDMDLLVVENLVLHKRSQTAVPNGSAKGDEAKAD